MHEPLISIIMPVYNSSRFLIDAVASIVEQSLTDWELICINDGSTDNSRQLLEWFAEEDARIRVIHQDNLGIVAALNHGCAIARAPLICRMDGDDVSMADRLEKQAAFMRRNPGCTVVGGAILAIDDAGDPLGVSRLPAGHDEIVDNLLHRRPGHFHPTTMIRAESLEAVGGYRKKYQWVEDHDLWLRLAQRGTLANLADGLLCYRQHAQSVCWRQAPQQRELMNELLREAYVARGLEIADEVLLDSDSFRTPAGPGKWARMAAKGGYARSTYKHLRKLIQSDAVWSYKARMASEAMLRLSIRRATDWLGGRQIAQIPVFPEWHRRAAGANVVSPTGARALPREAQLFTSCVP